MLENGETNFYLFKKKTSLVTLKRARVQVKKATFGKIFNEIFWRDFDVRKRQQNFVLDTIHLVPYY